MENTDTFAGGALGSNDKEIAPHKTELKREQDSVDDFEHLGGETSRREELGASPFHERKMATQSFLDTEREEMFVQPVRAELAVPDQLPVGTLVDKTADHVTDKFTHSELNAESVSESSLHRPESARADHDLAPSIAAVDPIPVFASSSATEPPKSIPSVVAEPKVVSEPEVPELKPFEPEPALPSEKSQSEPSKPESVASKTDQVVSQVKPLVEPAAIPATVKFEAPEPSKSESAPLKPELAPSKPEPASIKPQRVTPAKPEPSPAADPVRSPTAHIIEAEVIFCQMGLDAWFDPQRLHPKVESLMYWRDPARSGIALGAGLALLVALACCSVVSVFAYGSLLLLVAAVAFRIYKNVLQAVQKTNEGHPFKWLLEKDISIPAERAQASAAAATAHLNAVAAELRRLFLVEDLVDSLKFGVLLWCLTYVGACFNGITLIILGWIALFTLPKAYEMNKPQVDANLELARAKINEISTKVRAAVPLGRKSESEKDK